MYRCVLDGEVLRDREMLHDILIDALDLPEWYGRNLDALYDCLTDISEQAKIQIRNKSALEEKLGDYAKSLMKVLDRAAKENPNVNLEVMEG